MKAVLLCLRYVDTIDFRSLVCASWCSEEEKQVQKQKLRCLFSLEANTRALPAACCCYGVVAVLRLVLVLLLQLLPIALSSLLITCKEKTKEKKNVTKSIESKELREGSFPQ